MRHLTFLSASVLAALAATMPSTAHAATISSAGVRFPHAAVNAGGATVVAWERRTKDGFAVETRTGRAARRLGSTQRLSPRGYQPRVAVGADGTIAVAWLEYGDRGSRSMRVAVARPGQPLGKGRLLDRRTSNMAPVGVAVQPNGRVVAVWQRRADRLVFALAPRGRAFGRARSLAAQGPVSRGSIALDPRDGTVVVAYGTPVSSAPPVNQQAAVRALSRSATTFSAPTVLTANGPGTGPLNEAVPTAVAGPGGAAVTYTLGSTPRTLNIARRTARGRWAAPETIATAEYGESIAAQGLTATLPADGSAVAAWSIVRDAPDGLGGPVGAQNVASIAAPRTAFGPLQALTRTDGRAGPPVVAAAGSETFVASAEPRGPVVVATRPKGAGAVQAGTTLTTRGDGDVMLAAGGAHVLAVYQQRDRLQLKVVR